MKSVRQPLLVSIVVLAFAACGGGHKSETAKEVTKHAKPYVPPKTSPTEQTTTTTTTTVPYRPADVLALATRLGCVNPKADDPSGSISIDFGPKPTGSTECKLPDGTQIKVSTYTPDGIKAIKGPVLQSAICQLARGFNVDGPFYSVFGDDFEVDVTSDDTGIATPPNYKVKSQAVADALGLDLTTIDCKK